jgi:hypothetical protein
MDKATLEKEARAVFDDYLEAFQTGTRDDMDTFMHFPVAYIGEDSILVKERYPFDPEKLRATTDFVRADFKYEVVHIDDTKAHMVGGGTRHRADDSVIEIVESIYIMQKRDGRWGIVSFSGVRTPA